MLSNARYPRIAFHRMRMKTTKEQIRRRRRQRNLTSWKLANEAKRRTWRSEEKDGRDGTEKPRGTNRSEEENEDAKWRTGESSRGPYHGYHGPLAFPIIIPRVCRGRGRRLVLGTEGKVNPIASRKRGDLPTTSWFAAELRVFGINSRYDLSWKKLHKEEFLI